MGMTASASDDFCSLKGARELLRRIKTARQAQGLPCHLMVVKVKEYKDQAIYGVREKPVGKNYEHVGKQKRARYIGWHVDARKVCERTLEAFPGISVDDVLGPMRFRNICAARHACVMACLAADVADSQAALGRFFNVTEGAIHRIRSGRRTRSRLAA